MDRMTYAREVVGQVQRDVTGGRGGPVRSAWSRYRLERLYLDEACRPVSVVALVRHPDAPMTLLGMRVEAVPPEGPELMPAETWASIVTTNFEEALETRRSGGGSEVSPGEITWILT